MKQQTRRIGWSASALAAALVLTAGAVVRAEICGDLDGDGDVDMSDGGILLAAFGNTANGDIDGDGDTDQQDLAWFLTYFGSFNGGPCEPIGSGTMVIDLASVDNTAVVPGDDSQAPGFHGGVTHFTFDLVVDVTADNDWTSQWSHVKFTHPEVALFNHFYGSDVEPNSALFSVFPALEFDSFYASPPELFDWNPGFAWGPDWTSTGAEAIWFDTPRHANNIATTQRFTLVIPADSGIRPTILPGGCSDIFPVLGTITTDATAAASGADLLHAEFDIVDANHPQCPGDVDGDGDVDQSDLGEMLASWNLDDGGDLDGDGDTDQSDLGILLSNYNRMCGDDCDDNGLVDVVEFVRDADLDCNRNCVLDLCDILDGTSEDCNGNGVPDECDPDCNGNGVPDDCDVADGTSPDCNDNGWPDECDIDAGFSADCNGNGVPDECDVQDGTSADCNDNGIPDECDEDCNDNGVPDDCDVLNGTSADCNDNLIPDECEEDCNGNAVPDDCDVLDGTSADCNGNLIPDDCELSYNDCNDNGYPDDCDVADGVSEDCNGNGVPDECDIADGTSSDYNGNGIPDECEPGRTFIVDDDAPGDPGPGDIDLSDPLEDGSPGHPFDEIEEAAQVAIDGDTIQIRPGVYIARNVTGVDMSYRSLTISGSGVDQTVFDGEGRTQGFVIRFSSGPVLVEGISFINTIAPDYGSAIRGGQSIDIRHCNFTNCRAGIFGGAVTGAQELYNCTFNNNHAGTYGGGVFDGGWVHDCTFVENEATDSGGGLWRANPVENCTFQGNRSASGAALADVSNVRNCVFEGNIAVDGTALARTVEHCTFIGNTSTGGIATIGSDIFSAVRVARDCVFVGNDASSGDPANAIAGWPSEKMEGCLFLGNGSANSGPILRETEDGVREVVNCVFVGNESAEVVALAQTGNLRLANCSFYGNRTGVGGTTLRTTNPPVASANCILWSNSAGGIVDEAAQIKVPRIDYSIVQGWTGTILGEGNFSADPLFVDPDGPDGMLGTFDDNLRLRFTSPAIDSASASRYPTGFDVDADGRLRFVDLPSAPNTGEGDPPYLDRGAYEVQGP